MKNNDSRPVLEVSGLKVSFNMYGKGFKKIDLSVIQPLSIKMRGLRGGEVRCIHAT
ncbi:MAG TPA: hypothetical protein GX523_06520 [Desulfitobacterium dehalogenans]|uniref:Uncharacterized protein n=1 Tax=Desulfitobacterium dehalogenans TaxID=36854 RepID=A0A7C6Z3R2_9FIRM|nr:hypothetical protein [Desulfitobacterium dehalogenans]